MWNGGISYKICDRKCVKMSRNGRERGRGSKPYLTCKIFKKAMDRFSRASRKRFKLLWTDRKCGMAVFRTKFVIASKISGIDKIGHLKNLSCKKSGTDDTRKKNIRGETSRKGERGRGSKHYLTQINSYDEIEMHITNTSGNQPSLSILPI